MCSHAGVCVHARTRTSERHTSSRCRGHLAIAAELRDDRLDRRGLVRVHDRAGPALAAARPNSRRRLVVRVPRPVARSVSPPMAVFVNAARGGRYQTAPKISQRR